MISSKMRCIITTTRFCHHNWAHLREKSKWLKMVKDRQEDKTIIISVSVPSKKMTKINLKKISNMKTKSTTRQVAGRSLQSVKSCRVKKTNCLGWRSSLRVSTRALTSAARKASFLDKTFQTNWTISKSWTKILSGEVCKTLTISCWFLTKINRS